MDSNKNSLFTGSKRGVSAIDLNIMDDYPNPTYNAVITEIKSANKVLTGVNDFELGAGLWRFVYQIFSC